MRVRVCVCERERFTEVQLFTDTHTHSFPLCCYSILNLVPCALQQGLLLILLCVIVISADPELPAPGNHTSVLYVCCGSCVLKMPMKAVTLRLPWWSGG